MSVLPCITLTRLSAKPLRLMKNSFAHTVFSEDNPKDDEYESGVLDCVDRFSISNGNPAVPAMPVLSQIRALIAMLHPA